ncbi:MAG: s-methyl-5-thioribose-1-phosphate isomerase, partial [Bacillota bacterium]
TTRRQGAIDMEHKQGIELPFLIRPENVARYENGDVLILDRRVYPFEVKFVRCETYGEVARAIEDMVTQSGGPSYCAGYGMVQAAHRAVRSSARGILGELQRAAERLINTRPTNNRIRYVVDRMMKCAQGAIEEGADVEAALLAAMEKELEERHTRSLAIGKAGADLLVDGDRILTHCWAENAIVYTLCIALQEGKKLAAFCSETRPYLQGARLTADAIAEMGIPTTVITDNMPGYLMSKGMISKFFAGADRVTMDGHVINKIGTFQNAVCAHEFSVPFYAFCFGPDQQAATPEDIVIEERDPEEVLHCLGRRTATPRARGYYPAFDVTPPKYVSALVTDRGVLSPYSIGDYYRSR